MNNNPNNGPDNNGNGPKNSQTIMIFLVITVITLCVMGLFSKFTQSAQNKEITYTEFMSMVDKDQVAEVIIQPDKYVIKPKELPEIFSFLQTKDKVTYYTGLVDDPKLIEKLMKKGITVSRTIPDASGPIIWNILSLVVPLLMIWGLMFLLMRKMGGGGGGIMGIGKNKARVYAQKETGITFADVAGQEEAKESLQEVVDFLENPGKYTEIGAKLPKGALLVGPPGTGKTLLAKAVAGEAHCPFFSLSGSEFVEMFVGVGASRVRELFEEAKKNAPCIIFIDEIDAIGKSRDSVYGGGNDEREQTLNQLLAEMDGFDSQSGLLILAATNRPEVLDQALLRPGRFDRRVIVDRPDLQGRIDVLKVHSKNVRMDETVNLEELALATSGAVGSDLANMINEAAILAVKNRRSAVSQADLFEAMEVVIAGKEKKNKILSAQERRIVSYHEVGHALVSALQKDSEPVQKITIVPRTMGSLGYVLNFPEEERHLQNKEELLAMLNEFVAGRAAEEIVFGHVTTGASNDIEQATNVAKAMITQYGMSERFGMVSLASRESQYLSNRAVLNCSDQTQAEIDEEVRNMIKIAYDTALALLKEHRAALDKIAEFLIERESITGKEFMDILKKVEHPEEVTDEETPASIDEAIPVQEVTADSVIEEIPEEAVTVEPLQKEETEE